MHAALCASLRLTRDIELAAFSYQEPALSSQQQSIRQIHISSILTYQQRKAPSEIQGQEKLLMLCACMSLAKDFRDFEQKAGWVCKRDQLVQRIFQGQDTGIQRLAKHVGRYLASQDLLRGPRGADRLKFEAALRLGVKLEVLDEIGNANNLPCLSLLLGFECVRVSRLSFSSLGRMHELLKSDDGLHKEVSRFCRRVAVWWQASREFYHAQFGNTSASGWGACSISEPPIEAPECDMRDDGLDKARNMPCTDSAQSDTTANGGSYGEALEPLFYPEPTSMEEATHNLQFGPSSSPLAYNYW